METIYTIPVNEAFDEEGSCPFCRIHRQLEENEVELILGASMMEPDVRIQTNEKGFCAAHFKKMLQAQKRLPLALMLESHLALLHQKIGTPKITLKDKMRTVADANSHFAESCYICDRIEFHFGKMFETACLLWDADAAFRTKFSRQHYFCLPCYTRLLNTAKLYIPKKKQSDFLDAAQAVQTAYLESLQKDVSHFCRKFDYRFREEPWGNSRDSAERSIRFLTGEDSIEMPKEKE